MALKVVKADQAFVNSGGLDGRGVGVAVVDTGVALHRDLMRAKSSQVISGISQSPRPTAREQIVLRRLYIAHPTDVGASRHGLRAKTGAAVTSLTHRRCLDRGPRACERRCETGTPVAAPQG